MIVRTTVKSIQDIMRQDVGVDGDAQRISQLTWLFFLKIIDDQDQELEITKDGYRSPIPERFQWRNWAADPEGITGQALLDFVNDELFPALKGLQVSAAPEPIEELKPAVPVRKSVAADYIICLEDGKKFKSLKRHLRTHYNLSPEEYREKWGLPADYPMVAPNYSATRSRLAKDNGLGRKAA